ncbi:PepSY-like domain-containing protein [Spirosoma gilvum]
MQKIMLVGVAILLSGVSHAQTLKESAVPAAVKSSFTKMFPNAKSVKWSKESKTEFEAEFKNGTLTQAANFDASGSWVVTETEIKKAELPAPVAKAIAKDFAGYKTGECEKVEKPNKPMYFELKVEKGETGYVLEISPDGKILKKEKDVEEKDEKGEKND